MTKSRHRIWVIMPAFNEEKYVGKVVSEIYKITKNIIIVNDGSSDHTSQKIKGNGIYLLTHKVNLGKGSALKTGVEFAFSKLQADSVIMIDADAQHNPQHLSKFIKILKNDHQLIMGTRDISLMPVERKLGNQLASLLIWLLFGKYIEDIPSGYKAFTKEVYKTIEWQTTGYGVEMEIAVKMAKYRLEYYPLQIDTIYHDVDKGMTLLDALHMALLAIRWRFVL